MIPAVIWTGLGVPLVCTWGLIALMADDKVFTRTAFAELALMASKAMHRAPREPLRERVIERMRAWSGRPERLTDLETPLDHETNGGHCLRCMGARTDTECVCIRDCGDIKCSGERWP